MRYRISVETKKSLVVAANPQYIVFVETQCVNVVTRQALLNRIVEKMCSVETGYATALVREPKKSGTVLHDAAQHLVGQALTNTQQGKAA
jgi:hypothetical protein